ncbi:MAG: hypothetical protein JOY54_00185 [Acidobacteriaceae bacterium]|nr:hypothetical protein [Acidobacteriaceae bacterium]
MSAARVEIPGSAPKRRAAEQTVAPADPGHLMTATILVRHREGLPDIEKQLLSGEFKPVSREDAGGITSAEPGDMEAVRSFVLQQGLSVIDENLATRCIRVRGTVQQMDAAFGIHLQYFTSSDGKKYLSYEGPISIPASLDGVVIAVTGLDQRPIARPHSGGESF